VRDLKEKPVAFANMCETFFDFFELFLRGTNLLTDLLTDKSSRYTVKHRTFHNEEIWVKITRPHRVVGKPVFGAARWRIFWRVEAMRGEAS
jgi:hypothetical protein